MLKKPIKSYETNYPSTPGLKQYYDDCETCNVCNICENNGTNTCIWSNK